MYRLREVSSGQSGMVGGFMTKFQSAYNKTWKWALLAMFVTGLAVFAVFPAFAGKGHKYETIAASAMGTSTQMGQIVQVQLDVYGFSTPEDRQVLIGAFEKGQTKGLVNALQKMKAVGRCSITGTVGDDVAFIEAIPTPTGRKIRFITHRPILFGEAFTNSQSTAYNLTAGEIDLNDTDKRKSTGVLFPAAQFTIDKNGQLSIELIRNPWKLVNVIDWPGTPGVS
jgi:hypothetical protein